MAARTVRLDGASLSIDDVKAAATGDVTLDVPETTWTLIDQVRERVDAVAAANTPAYGVNTGFGSQKEASVSLAGAREFNRRILVAHATVVADDELSGAQVRAALLVHLNQLATGRSGVRRQLFQALIDRFERGDRPRASAGASVGASDIVPMSQLALPVVVGGGAFDDERFEEATLDLAPKEALSLMNSSATSLGPGALVLARTRQLLAALELSFALALEGFRGHPGPLDEEVGQARPHPGQIGVAARVRELLDGSALHDDGAPRFLQDPESFRVATPVLGAAHEALAWAEQVWTREINGSNDNPLVALKGEPRVISHGNFDTTLCALVLDTVRAATLCALETACERSHKLHWSSFTGLPMGLARGDTAGEGVQQLNLGHLLEAQAAQARSRARPTLSLYRAQLSEGVEDHASHLPLAVRETDAFLDAAWVVVTLEAVIAAWAIRRRGVDATVGERLRPIVARIVDHLPAPGGEGYAVLDLRPITDVLREVADELA